MTYKAVQRRDALKVFGSIGVSALASQLFNRQLQALPQAPETSQANFLVIVFDALSARHMSLYGYPRDTTPNIDKFAQSAITYHRHYSASNFTQSATAGLLTGVHAWSHRSLEFFETLLSRYEEQNLFNRFSPLYHTLGYSHNIHAVNIMEQFGAGIELLKPIQDLVLFQANKLEYIFDNDIIIGEYAAKRWLEHFLSPSYSLLLNPIFETASALKISEINAENKDLYPIGLPERDGYLFKLEDAIDWIIQVSRRVPSPYLGYFHLLPPHEDYKPHAAFYNRYNGDQNRLVKKPEHFFSQGVSDVEFQAYCDRYDEYIAHVDEEFGRLVRELETSGALEKTYVILTTDHGQLFERGIHGHLEPVLYESVIHTPLVIHQPGQTKGVEVHTPTSSLDLAPTLLSLAGLTLRDEFEGKLLPALGGEEEPDRIILSMHARRNAKLVPLSIATFAVIQWPFKYIQYRGYEGIVDTEELFDLENDPDELKDLAGENQSLVAAFREELNRQQLLAEVKSLKSR